MAQRVKRRPLQSPLEQGGKTNPDPRPTPNNGSGDNHIVSDPALYDNLRVARAMALMLALSLAELVREWKGDGSGSKVQEAQRLAQAALSLADDVRALAAQDGS